MITFLSIPSKRLLQSLVVSLAVCANSAYASTLFSDSFQSQSDLNAWTSGGGEIVTAPGGGKALSFNRIWGGGDIYTNNTFVSSTGSFTISFDYFGSCGHSTNCGGFVYAGGDVNRWILSDTSYGNTNFPDTNTWQHLSYSFSGNYLNLALEIWSGSAYASPHSFYWRNLVLTDNSEHTPIGTLTLSNAAVPEPETITLFIIGLLGLNLIHKKEA